MVKPGQTVKISVNTKTLHQEDN